VFSAKTTCLLQMHNAHKINVVNFFHENVIVMNSVLERTYYGFRRAVPTFLIVCIQAYWVKKSH